MTRILLLSVSAGAGHGRAEVAASFPSVDAKHLDVTILVPSSFRALYADHYIKIVEHHRSVWAYIYSASDKMPGDAWFAKVRRAVEGLNTRHLRDTLTDYPPDHIICTHFLPAELLAHEIHRGRAVPPVWLQVADLPRRPTLAAGYFLGWPGDDRLSCLGFPFVALIFHVLVFLRGRWSWRMATRIMAMIKLFWLIEDALWFVLNPAFGWSKFSPAPVPWPKHCWGPLPADYRLSSAIGGRLLVWPYRVKS